MKKPLGMVVAGAFLLGMAAVPAVAEEPASKSLEDRVAAIEKVWKGIEFKGDLRLRYEFRDNKEGADRDRSRGRFRLRAGLGRRDALPGLNVGFRLASGEDSGANSANQTMDDHFNKKPVWIDLAYAVYTPPAVPDLTVGAGKVANPFFSTEMVWDSNVNPEGIYARYGIGPKELRVTVLPAYFVVEEEKTKHDATLAAAQVRVDVDAGPVAVAAAAAYYDYRRIEDLSGGLPPTGNTTTGGRLNAEEFNIIDVLAVLRFQKLPLPVEVFADYAKNIGEDVQSPPASATDTGLDTAYGAGARIGTSGNAGDWYLSYMYRSIEANAVIGFFSESTFGGANKKGHIGKAGYTIHKSVQFDVSFYSVKQKDPVGGAATTDIREEFKVLQTDLVLKF